MIRSNKPREDRPGGVRGSPREEQVAPLTDERIQAIADAVASRLGVARHLTGWPDGRGTLNESETAEYLSIGVDFLRQLRQEGKISHRKIGRRIVYSPADIATFLDDCGAGGD